MNVNVSDYIKTKFMSFRKYIDLNINNQKKLVKIIKFLVVFGIIIICFDSLFAMM